MIHGAGIVHNDLKLSNMMVDTARKNGGVWIDLSASTMPPFMLISEEKHDDVQKTESIILEYFFTQLAQLPENQGMVLTTADVAELLGGPPPERWFMKYGFKLLFHQRRIKVLRPENG
ncbi:hypothetical protein VTN00DRAFT_5822 [Thermoascus crustaceus]|uniref:uncharacterized protein n=1 Tax=Thermoascus crustaceus TaxID=5088 RepID=UPI0037421393